MANTLELRMTFRGEQAIDITRKLTRELENANKAQEKLDQRTKELNTAMRNQSSAVASSTSKWGSFKSSLVSSQSIAKGTFSIMSQTAKTTYDQIGALVNRAKLLGVFFGGIIAYKTLDGLKQFNTQFGLMNATLKAKLPETLNFLKSELLSASDRTGTAVETITDSLNQLFSSGFSPKAKEGTAAYKNELKDTLTVLEMLNKFSVSTQSNVLDMSTSLVYAANAFDLNAANIADATYLLDMFGTTLDTGIGWMSQYGDQFVKFAKEAKTAGATNEEAFAVFSKLTKTMNPEIAGFTTGNVFRTITKGAINASVSAERVTSQLKSMNEQLSGEQQKKLQEWTDPAKWAGVYFEKGKKKNFTGVIESMKELTNIFPDTDAANAVLATALATDIRAIRGIRELTSEAGGADFTDILKQMEEGSKKTEELRNMYNKQLGSLMTAQSQGYVSDKEYEINKAGLDQKFLEALKSAGNITSEKWELYTKQNFAFTWAVATTNMRNALIRASDAMAPAFDSIITSIFDIGEDGLLAGERIKRGFALAREQLKSTYPSLIPILDGLEKVVKWTMDVEGGQKAWKNLKSTFTTISNSIAGLWTTLQPFIEWVASNPVVNLPIAIIGMNAARATIGELAGVFTKSLMTSNTGQLSAIGKAISSGFLLAAIAGAGYIGIEMAKSYQNQVYTEQNEAQTGRLESFKKLSLAEQLRALPSTLRGLQDPASEMYSKASSQWGQGNYFEAGKSALFGLGEAFTQNLKELGGQVGITEPYSRNIKQYAEATEFLDVIRASLQRFGVNFDPEINKMLQAPDRYQPQGYERLIQFIENQGVVKGVEGGLKDELAQLASVLSANFSESIKNVSVQSTIPIQLNNTIHLNGELLGTKSSKLEVSSAGSQPKPRLNNYANNIINYVQQFMK